MDAECNCLMCTGKELLLSVLPQEDMMGENSEMSIPWQGSPPMQPAITRNKNCILTTNIQRTVKNLAL